MSVLRLAIASPLRQIFDYLPPEGLSPQQLDELEPGVRLRVPFGSRIVTAYLVETADQSEIAEKSLKQALELLDNRPLLDRQLMRLCLWAAKYYLHPIGEVINAAFPRTLRDGRSHQPLTQTALKLTQRGLGLPDGALKRSPRQAEALAILQEREVVAIDDFRELGITSVILGKLLEKQLIERCALPAATADPTKPSGIELSREQAAIINSLQQFEGGFSCHLIEGVTGSGKTEIYLQEISRCLREGLQALVLIPEIGLTPQTLKRFEQRFGRGIAVLHSGLSDKQRYEAWEAARTGQARIIIGTRSAVFTPLAKPGLIVVDEEHDSSYKQQDGLRYSARDVAVKRGQLCDCRVLLGSATPSLESIHNARNARYHAHKLTQRAGQGVLPEISVLDVRRKPLHAGISEPLLAAIHETLNQSRQVLLFLNRRGYAPALQCHDCGWLSECPACDARFTVHRRQRRLRCHHCGASQPLPQRCPNCHSKRLLTSGLGTEQTEVYLGEQFSQWPVFRVDSDSMRRRDAMQRLVEDINRGEHCLLLGTQMLAKGHHFPAVSLVAIIDTDALLFSPDFRGEERMAQLLTQVAGRAGRDDNSGRVLLQTHYPDHPALAALAERPYGDIAMELLKQREASGLPPIGQLVLVRSDSVDKLRGEQFLQQLRSVSEPGLPHSCNLIGPLPSPMQRRAGKFRSQLLLMAPSRRLGHRVARQMTEAAEGLPGQSGIKWSIDVDPTELL